VTGRPLMAALDLFGRRWALRVIWELHRGALGFRSLRQNCDDMSSSVLRQRLTELLDARLICQLPDMRYALTPLGESAHKALLPLDRWAHQWSEQLASDVAGPNRAAVPEDAAGGAVP
jgi:DNA-binding HxlR family transcriptional regulator